MVDMPYSSDLSDAEWEVLEPLLHDILQKKLTSVYLFSGERIYQSL